MKKLHAMYIYIYISDNIDHRFQFRHNNLRAGRPVPGDIDMPQTLRIDTSWVDM